MSFHLATVTERCLSFQGRQHDGIVPRGTVIRLQRLREIKN